MPDEGKIEAGGQQCFLTAADRINLKPQKSKCRISVSELCSVSYYDSGKEYCGGTERETGQETAARVKRDGGKISASGPGKDACPVNCPEASSREWRWPGSWPMSRM